MKHRVQRQQGETQLVQDSQRAADSHSEGDQEGLLQAGQVASP